MDKKHLLTILKNPELQSMPINKFDKGFAGTLKIAQAYLENNKDYNFEYETNNKLIMYYKNRNIGYLKGQTPSTNSRESINISKNKFQTEKILQGKNIHTTVSNLYGKDDFDKARDYVENNNKLLVVKPNKLSAGRGITLNVTYNNFKEAWELALNACKEQEKEIEILIQEQFEGIESRFIIINNKFESAMLRVPANISGNGENTIHELIDAKNLLRAGNPHLRRLPIKKDQQTLSILKSQNMTLNTIPKSNEIVLLRHSSNVSQGGDNYEISHIVSDSMKRLSELSVKAIPGLNTAGIDILYTDFNDDYPKVLEVNPGANLRMHHYPWKGNPKYPIHTLIKEMTLL